MDLSKGEELGVAVVAVVAASTSVPATPWLSLPPLLLLLFNCGPLSLLLLLLLFSLLLLLLLLLRLLPKCGVLLLLCSA